MTDTRVASLLAYEALDSRGHPTVACVARLGDGTEAEALVAAGASTGSHEARERRDGGQRYGGRGVRDVVDTINGEVCASLIGHDAADQLAIDDHLRALDGTAALEHLGANAVLAASLACCRAAAAARRLPLWRHVAGDADPLLPLPMVNIFSGGAHAGGVVDVQDYLAIPVGAASVAESLEWVSRVRQAAADLLRLRGGNADLVADEGGLAHRFDDNTAAFGLLSESIERAGLRAGDDVGLAVDVAATQLVVGPSRYRLAKERRTLTTEEMVTEVSKWTQRFPIVSIEDPLGEDDWSGFAAITAKLPGVQIIGDDLFATSLARVERGLSEAAATAVLAKINQNGTVSGTAEVARTARAAGMAVVVSARSGETEDASIADLAVGWRTGQLKVGSLTRSERTAKWNRLLRIEAELGGAAEFAGRAALIAAPVAGSG